jgi:hypothetical protein
LTQLLAILIGALVVTACSGATRLSTPPTADATEIARLMQDPTVQMLVALAKAKIDAEYHALITGDTSVLDPEALSVADEAAAQLTGVIAAGQLRRHEGLARCGAGYTASQTSIRIEHLDIQADRARIAAVVHTEWRYQSGPSAEPVRGGEAPHHIFRFEHRGQHWLLTEDVPESFPRIAPPPGPPSLWDRLFAPPRIPTGASPATPPACTRPTDQGL